MTLLTKFNNYHPFPSLMDDFFTPTFTRKITIDHDVLADIENYSIWELPTGKHEVRVQYSDQETTYHRASTKETLEEAEQYVEEQVAYHTRRMEGPKLVKNYKNAN